MPDHDDDRADAALLFALGEALGPDPVPHGLIERATAMLAFADVDEELVTLLADAGSDLAVVGSRGDGGASGPAVYTSPDGSVTIEAHVDGDTLLGLLVGSDAATVALERPTGDSSDAAVEALGHFRFVAAPRGPARLRVRSVDGSVCTEWFVV